MARKTAASAKRKVVGDGRHQSSQVILFIDTINHFEFPDGASLLKQSLQIAPNLLRLKDRANRAKVPIVYVNDNFGQWRSERAKLIEYCLRPESKGRDFVRQIAPSDEDYFVLKPMHSAFYQTPLDVLLRYFEASTLILCGISTNSCIICTAHDAKMRDFELIVAADCCAARSPSEHAAALKHIELTSAGRVLYSQSIKFARKHRRIASA